MTEGIFTYVAVGSDRRPRRCRWKVEGRHPDAGNLPIRQLSATGLRFDPTADRRVACFAHAQA